MKSIKISFYLNDHAVTYQIEPGQTALDLIRNGLGLTGTKEGCSEGDCGACTVALGTMENGRLAYRAVASCILPAAKLHGRHVITIEGLARGDKLHPIQQAVLEEHATQCGFCTPGIVMSLFCLFAGNTRPTVEELNASLEGNLCRCTGYDSIRKAALRVSDNLANKLLSCSRDILPTYIKMVERGLKKAGECQANGSETADRAGISEYHQPETLPQLFAVLRKFRSCNQYRLISGGTDVMVDRNIKKIYPEHLVDISGIQSLRGIKVAGKAMSIGANVTLSKLVESPVVRRRLPVLAQTVAQMASAQIRNTATLAGNLANASPIADGSVLMLALGARLKLVSPRGSRTVSIDDFYKSYRHTCLGEREIIARIEVPMDGSLCSFIKSAKRRSVDISTVNSAVKLKLSKGRITETRIALGGVAPTPVLALKAAASLAGKGLTEETIVRTADMAASECTPISDVRGGADYRKMLVRNHVLRHLRSIALNLTPNPAASREGEARVRSGENR